MLKRAQIYVEQGDIENAMRAYKQLISTDERVFFACTALCSQIISDFRFADSSQSQNECNNVVACIDLYRESYNHFFRHKIYIFYTVVGILMCIGIFGDWLLCRRFKK